MSCKPCGKAVGLAKSLIAWTAVGLPLTDGSLTAFRISTCEGCEFYRKPICIKCGCVIAIKARMATAKCPEDKW